MLLEQASRFPCSLTSPARDAVALVICTSSRELATIGLKGLPKKANAPSSPQATASHGPRRDGLGGYRTVIGRSATQIPRLGCFSSSSAQ